MNLKNYFQARRETIVNIHMASNGCTYVITDKANYKQDTKGILFKFNNGLLNKNQNRWEEIR